MARQLPDVSRLGCAQRVPVFQGDEFWSPPGLNRNALWPLLNNMNIVYNSDNYYVVEYPQQHGYEVVDKQAGRGTYFGGNVAERFRVSMIGALGVDPSPEHVDEFLCDFGGLITFSTTLH